MKFKFLLLLFTALLGVRSGSFAQYSLKLKFQIDTPAVFVAADNLDNIYLMTSKNQVLKYNPAGKLLWNYSNRSFGKLSYINVTDPMRILLYYPGIQQAVVLNNNLNEITRFNFGDDASQSVSLIATANSNGYWVYDQLNRQLEKLGSQFNIEISSGNIYQQSRIDIQPSFIQASDQNVYLLDSKQGILQFDRFGTYLASIPANGINYFQTRGDKLMYLKNHDWYCYSAAANEQKKLYTFEQTPLQASEGNKLLAVLMDDGVKVFSITTSDDKK